MGVLVEGCSVQHTRPDAHSNVGKTADSRSSACRFCLNMIETLLSGYHLRQLAWHLEVFHGDKELCEEESWPGDCDFWANDQTVVLALGSEKRVSDAKSLNDSNHGTDDEHQKDRDHEIVLVAILVDVTRGEAHGCYSHTDQYRTERLG